VARGYLGLQLAQSFEPADALKLGLDHAQGALVETVYADTPRLRRGCVPTTWCFRWTLRDRNENHLIHMISGILPDKR